jgi:hypothetical protein
MLRSGTLRDRNDIVLLARLMQDARANTHPGRVFGRRHHSNAAKNGLEMAPASGLDLSLCSNLKKAYDLMTSPEKKGRPGGAGAGGAACTVTLSKPSDPKTEVITGERAPIQSLGIACRWPKERDSK